MQLSSRSRVNPFEITEVVTPEPGPGEVRVGIGGSGVCHSGPARQRWRAGRSWLHRRPTEILGHENAGGLTPSVRALPDCTSALDINEDRVSYLRTRSDLGQQEVGW